jgi:hypothetical protein
VKGLSLNVTLSNEQIEEIASLTVDKVRKENIIRYGNEEWYRHEIEELKRDLVNRNKMIVEREIHIERWKKSSKFYKSELQRYKEKFGEIE